MITKVITIHPPGNCTKFNGNPFSNWWVSLDQFGGPTNITIQSDSII